MPTYSNGRVPEDLLVIFARGQNATDGVWFHGLPAATYARHLALVARALLRTGRRLTITDGWGAYRPYAAQVLAERIYGTGAARPGTSSHGLFWEGMQCAAIDYGNWAWVYQNHGGFAAFKEDCAAVGLWAGAIMPNRGYPREEWHVVDTDPWSAVPAGFDSIPLEDDMPTAREIAQEILGYPAYDNGPSISQFYKNVDQGGIATQVWARTVDRGEGGKINALQELADVKTMAMQLLGRPVGEVTVDVDEEAIAASVVALVSSSLGSLSDETIAKLVTAGADEQDRRARERLET